MTVSIVIPAYRAQGTIARVVESVLAQTRSDWEAIVVSDDGTDYADALSATGITDERLRFVTTGRVGSGCHRARNTGLAAARGDFIAALDADDLILPGHYEPFTGHRAWIEETAVHHRERCDEIRNLVRRTPQTAHQMVAELWRRELSPINHHFAIFEVLAHLEHMHRRSEVQHRPSNGALEWHA